MRTYLKAQSLWDIIKNGSIQIPLLENLTIIHLKSHIKEMTKEGKTLVVIQATLHVILSYKQHYM